MSELSEYRRITIIGDSGVGKSTLARELERLTGLPVIKYDGLWAELPNGEAGGDELSSIVRGLVAGPAWIFDGNGHPVRDIVWPRTELLIWLDYPLRVLALRKGLKAARKVVRGARYGAFRHQLRKQALCYGGTVRRHRPNARQRRALLADPAYAHVHQLTFGHPSDTSEWLRAAVRAPMPADATLTIHT